MNTAKKRKYGERLVMFATGAAAYTAAELLWRGHTHWTMALTGGTCVLLIHAANARLKNTGIVPRCAAGCLIITSVEFAVGCVVNLLLGWRVWDYSSLPFNVLGQICLPYSLCWFALSLPCVALSNWMIGRRRNSPIIFG